MSDDLYQALRRANSAADEAAEREAAAKLKKIKARRALEKAEDEYDRAADLYQKAVGLSRDAYNRWNEGRGTAPQGGAP